MTKQQRMQAGAWAVSSAAVILAVIAWGQSFDWQFGPISTYKVFPLFGLVAFSLMWSHYVVSAIRQYFKLDPKVLSDYFEITAAIVLTAIVFHPGLLLWQLWRDGLGLPPGSTKVYVGAAAYWAIWLGITAWAAFMSYELRRVFGKKRWWPLVQHASDVAMFLVFVHALKLGGALRLGWFRAVWFFYGITLAGVLIHSYVRRIQQSKIAK